jgi:hypothetical protein
MRKKYFVKDLSLSLRKYVRDNVTDYGKRKMTQKKDIKNTRKMLSSTLRLHV